MTDNVIELVKYVDKNLPEVGIQVNTFYKTYFCKENQAMKNTQLLKLQMIQQIIQCIDIEIKVQKCYNRFKVVKYIQLNVFRTIMANLIQIVIKIGV